MWRPNKISSQYRLKTDEWNLSHGEKIFCGIKFFFLFCLVVWGAKWGQNPSVNFGNSIMIYRAPWMIMHCNWIIWSSIITGFCSLWHSIYMPMPSKYNALAWIWEILTPPPPPPPPPSVAYMHHWIGSALVQIMACRLIGAEPLSEPMLEYCWLDS